MLKNKSIKNFQNKKAYTLVELTIAILVISLLMAGIFSMATGSINVSKSTLATQRMNEIYKSLGTYLMVNKRLPCPASIVASKINDASYGEELRVVDANGSNCGGYGVYTSSSAPNLFFGAVPIKSLNLSSEYAEDGFENKIGYVIDARFTMDFVQPGAAFKNSFGTVDVEDPANPTIIAVKESVTSDALLGQKFILLLISYGANGNGAFRVNDGGQNGTVVVDAGEDENKIISQNFNRIFVNNSFGSDIFDDVLMYKARQDFIVDFRANNYNYCPAFAVAGSNFTATNLYYNQFLYANTSCPGDNTLIQIKRCTNIAGEWKDVMASCPAII